MYIYFNFSNTGTLISGTHCSRIFSDCDRKPCRLQSPNYPGVYPRNLTCYYAIRQVCSSNFALSPELLNYSFLLFIQTLVPYRRICKKFYLGLQKKTHILFILYPLQHDVPPGKHALITVRQPKGDLLWIQTVLKNKKENDKEKVLPEITTWDNCDIVQVNAVKHFRQLVHAPIYLPMSE